jgi:hypothetical protein
MLKFIIGLLSISVVSSVKQNDPNLKNVSLIYGNAPTSNVSNGCISFTVSSGTGCAWMCDYCASNLGTNNYYFTNGVCTYQSGGCVGTPQVGVQYTCCSV